MIVFRTVYKETLEIRDRMQLLYPGWHGEWVATDSRWRFAAGGTVQIAHASNLKEITEYLGNEFTAVLWDELSLVADETVWQMILARIRSTDPTVPLRARASANPIGPGRAWLKARFVDPCGADGAKVYRDPETGRTRAFVPGTADDNPLLPQAYWQGLADLPPSIQAALRYGDWSGKLGLFYPELEDTRHLVCTLGDLPPLLDWHEYWGAFDWGFGHPAVACSFVRIGDTVTLLDAVYCHRYQDEEMAATISGSLDRRCLRQVYAGHDAFAKRQAHSASAETVADVFERYGVHLERANLDRVAGAQVLRRLLAPPRPGPIPKGTVTLRIVDTAGTRRLLTELQSLVPDETNPKAPAKRDANERGLGGDDGADCLRYGLVTPTLEPREAPPVWEESNVADGKAPPAPWEVADRGFRRVGDRQVDRREVTVRRGVDTNDIQFPDYGIAPSTGDGW